MEDPALNMGALGMPKILGFDFIVNANRKPFLLEVTVCRVGATKCKQFLRQASRGLWIMDACCRSLGYACKAFCPCQRGALIL
jgi:hypothetical protein